MKHWKLPIDVPRNAVKAMVYTAAFALCSGQVFALTLSATPASPVKYGDTIHLHITGGQPNEAYTFSDGSFIGGGGTLDSSGNRDIDKSTLNYSPGDITFSATGGTSGNTNVLSYHIDSADSTTTVTSDIQPSFPGQNVTLTATITVNPTGAVPGDPTNTSPGTVQFKDNGVNLGAAQSITNTGGVYTASITTSISSGSHPITAVYSGDGTFSFDVFDDVTFINGSTSDPFTLSTETPPTVSVSDAVATVPASGTNTALFTVTLSAPVTGQPVDVFYDTAPGGPNPGVDGTDYNGPSGTLTFAAGETSKTIPVPIPTTATASKTFVFNLNSTAPVLTITDNQGLGTLVAETALGQLLISEFRFRGANGVNDEFVELYNAAATDLTVATGDGSAGWSLVGADGVVRATVPSGTVVPSHSHYLLANSSGYSLSALAVPDLTYPTDLPDGGGVALFRTATPANFTLAERLDAAGYDSVADPLYKEGTGFNAPVTEAANNIEYSFVRKTALTGPTTGLPVDTDNNLTDFTGIATMGEALGTSERHLGSPGPEGSTSPLQINDLLSVGLIDGSKAGSEEPNRTVDYTDRSLNVTAAGAIILRRTVTNNGLTPITSLQLRVVDQTTLPFVSGTSDVRAMSVATDPVYPGGPLLGTTVVNAVDPAIGGGLNTILSVNGIDGAHPLAVGATVEIAVKLGIQNFGSKFRFVANFEGK